MSDPNPYQPVQPLEPAQPPAAYRPGSYSERYAGTQYDPGIAPPVGYGAPPSYGTPGARPPDKRPGTVTAAGVIGIVFCTLSMVFDLVAVVFLAANRARLERAILDRADTDVNLKRSLDNISPDQIVNLLIGLFVVLAVLTAVALLMSVLVLRRSKIARVLLVIFSALTALSSLLGIGSGVSAITLIAAISVIVLLFTGGANDWFARRTKPGFGY